MKIHSRLDGTGHLEAMVGSCLFETGPRSALAILKLTMWSRMTLNFRSFCFYFLSAEVGMYNYTQFYVVLGMEPGASHMLGKHPTN